MIKRIWNAIKEACTPHPEKFDGPLSLIGSINASPRNAAVMEAAETAAEERHHAAKQGAGSQPVE